jgi:hypothetical protein
MVEPMELIQCNRALAMVTQLNYLHHQILVLIASMASILERALIVMS